MRKIGLELSPSGITVGDVIQGADAVDDPGQLSVQDRVSRTISSMRVLPPSNGLFGKSAAVAGSSPASLPGVRPRPTMKGAFRMRV